MTRSPYQYTRQDARTERRVSEAVEEFLREYYDEHDAMCSIPVYLEEQDYESELSDEHLAVRRGRLDRER